MNKEKLENIKLEASSNIVAGVMNIFSVSVFDAFIIYLLSMSADEQTRKILSIFLIITVFPAIWGIILILKGRNMKKAIKNTEEYNFSNSKKIAQKHKVFEKSANIAKNIFVSILILPMIIGTIIGIIECIGNWKDGGIPAAIVYIFALLFEIVAAVIAFKNKM